MLNIATLYAIYEAVAKDKPLIERVVTISGDSIKERKNLMIPIGSPISEVVDFCGGLNSEDILAIAGGPMMGLSLPDLNRNTVKGSNALVFLDNSKIKKDKEYPCISCSTSAESELRLLVSVAVGQDSCSRPWTTNTDTHSLGSLSCPPINLVHP